MEHFLVTENVILGTSHEILRAKFKVRKRKLYIVV